MKKLLSALAGLVVMNLSAAILTSEALKDYDGNSTGSVTITGADGEEIASGSDVSGTVTITANGDDFTEWVGTFPSDATISGNQISFTMPETAVRVTPVYKGMWILDEIENTITDGYWILVASSINEDKKTFQIGKWDATQNKPVLVLTGKGDMDLSRVIVSKENGEQYKITVIYGTSLAYATDVIYSLVLPKTLTWGQKGMLNAKVTSVMTNLVMDCPLFVGDENGFGSWNFFGHKKLERVVLKVPKVAFIGDQIFSAAPLSETNLDEWDLSGVTEISGTFIVSESDYGNQLKGVIRLPNIKKVSSDAFKNWKHISGIVLGSNLTVESIGANAIPNLENLKTLVIGCSANGCTLAEKAITVSPNMSEFVFLSGMPTPFDTTSINWANETCLYTPKTRFTGADSWTDLLGETTSLGDDEKTAFQNNSKYAGLPVAESKFPQSKFGQTVYCGRTYLPAWGIGAKVIVSVGDERARDTVRIKGVEAKRHEILVEPGESVTASAVLVNEEAGCTWNCPGNADGEKDYTITAGELGSETFCTLWPRTVWTYLPKGAEGNPYGNGIITNAYWTLNVKVYNQTSKRLEIWNKDFDTSQKDGRAHGWVSGEGYLDLNGPVIGTDNSEWTITHISSCALSSAREIPESQKATMIVYPRTIRSLAEQHLNSNNADSSCVTNLVINAPEATGTMKSWFAYGMGKLQTLTLKIPKITQLGEDLFDEMGSVNVDFSKWDLSSVTNIGKRAFYGKGKALPAKGVLRLPKIMTFGEGSFFALAPETIELGTGYDISDKHILTLGKDSFYTQSYVKSIKFGPYKSIDSSSTLWPLNGGDSVEEMIFEGRWSATMQDAIDKILLSYNASTGAKSMTIYASSALDWDDIADGLSETEKTIAPAGCIGVYRDGLRKAWIVQRKSQYDPRGTVLIVR